MFTRAHAPMGRQCIRKLAVSNASVHFTHGPNLVGVAMHNDRPRAEASRAQAVTHAQQAHKILFADPLVCEPLDFGPPEMQASADPTVSVDTVSDADPMDPAGPAACADSSASVRQPPAPTPLPTAKAVGPALATESAQAAQPPKPYGRRWPRSRRTRCKLWGPRKPWSRR